MSGASCSGHQHDSDNSGICQQNMHRSWITSGHCAKIKDVNLICKSGTLSTKATSPLLIA